MVHLRKKNLETLMKSRNEFTTKEEYNEYLRTYFTGLAMQVLENLQREDMEEDFARTAIKAEIVVLEKN